jgi:molybdopterin/thiamine biosynthesis adenylyltransferase
MTHAEINNLIEVLSFQQLVSAHEIGDRTFSIKLQGRSRIWSVCLYFYETFPFSLPKVKLLDENCIGKIPHVNSYGTVCVEESDSILVNHHLPSEVIEAYLVQTLKLLDRSLLGIFKDELYDELEGFIHGVKTVNSFYKANNSAEKLVLRITHTTNPLGPKKAIPVFLSNDNSTIPKAFSNIEKLNDIQLINIVHIPLKNPITPPITEKDSALFISDMKREISTENNAKLQKILKKGSKKKRQFFSLISMPRTNGDRSEFLCEFTVNDTSVHPLLTERLDWKIYFYLLNRHNKEYLLERGGANLNLNEKKVAIVGCGSVGSEVAMMLAKSGVGHIRLVDGEWLEADNIYRHRLGGRYLNFKPSQKSQEIQKYTKVKALEDEIKVNIPHVKVSSLSSPLSAQNAKDVISGVDLVIFAIGDPSLSLMFNKVLKQLNFNHLIFCWNEPDGYGGHSTILNLKQVCLECVFHAESGSKQSIHLVEMGQPISKNLTGCAGVFTPFSYIDSTRTASLAAQQAICFLSSEIIEPKVSSWKGIDKGTLRVTDRFHSMPLMEDVLLVKNNSCRCCNGEF